MEYQLLNAAGEVERDRLSARENALEALVFASMVLLGSWLFCYEVGIKRGHLAVQDLTTALLKVGIGWVLLASPWLHGDTATSLGFGRPREVWQRMKRGQWGVAAVVVAMMVSLIAIGMTHWPLTARFFKLPAAAQLWPESAGGYLCMFAFCAAVAGVFAMWFIRYENFGASLWAAVKGTWWLVPLAMLIAFLHGGLDAFAVLLTARKWLDVLAYVFWGGMQQILFTGWFGTRIRKGFGPAKSRAGRFGIALLSASFFGLIHLPSYRLVAVTLMLGTIFAWLAMEDRHRNLAAFAVVHGVLGATIAKLFSGDAAGALRIRFRVGPWNAAGDPWVTWVAVACVCIYAAVAVWGVMQKRAAADASPQSQPEAARLSG